MKRLHTDEPITVALKPLMQERRLTFRALAELTRSSPGRVDGSAAVAGLLAVLRVDGW